MVTVQSEKLSSPVGSLVEGLNREPSSEFTGFSTRTTPAAAADTDTDAISQFRSPLLRQMMGNKLASGGRPASATNDDTMSAPSAAITSVSDDSLDTDEVVTTVEMAVGSTTQTDQPLAAAELSANTETAYIEDEIAVCDEPLEPSPRIPPLSANDDVTSTELATPKLVPIEVWTEDTAVDLAYWEQRGGEGGLDDKDELCVEDEPSEPSPGLAEDACVPCVPDDNCESKPDPSSCRSDNSIVDEPCVDDAPSEPSALAEVEVHLSGKPEERTSVVDEDRDVDTTEALTSDVKVDPALDTMKWNGVEKSHAHVNDWPSAIMNGYPDNDTRM